MGAARLTTESDRYRGFRQFGPDHRAPRRLRRFGGRPDSSTVDCMSKNSSLLLKGIRHGGARPGNGPGGPAGAVSPDDHMIRVISARLCAAEPPVTVTAPATVAPACPGSAAAGARTPCYMIAHPQQRRRAHGCSRRQPPGPGRACHELQGRWPPRLCGSGSPPTKPGKSQGRRTRARLERRAGELDVSDRACSGGPDGLGGSRGEQRPHWQSESESGRGGRAGQRRRLPRRRASASATRRRGAPSEHWHMRPGRRATLPPGALPTP